MAKNLKNPKLKYLGSTVSVLPTFIYSLRKKKNNLLFYRLLLFPELYNNTKFILEVQYPPLVIVL